MPDTRSLIEEMRHHLEHMHDSTEGSLPLTAFEAATAFLRKRGREVLVMSGAGSHVDRTYPYEVHLRGQVQDELYYQVCIAPVKEPSGGVGVAAKFFSGTSHAEVHEAQWAWVNSLSKP